MSKNPESGPQSNEQEDAKKGSMHLASILEIDPAQYRDSYMEKIPGYAKLAVEKQAAYGEIVLAEVIHKAGDKLNPEELTGSVNELMHALMMQSEKPLDESKVRQILDFFREKADELNNLGSENKKEK